MTKLLSKVASYTNTSEAEWARCRLGFEGIPAFLENACFVLTCWEYSQVSGGAKVFVPTEQAPRACEILNRKQPPDDRPYWSCAKCSQSSPGDWSVCWRCGTSRDGVEDPDFFAEYAPVSVPRRPLLDNNTLAILLGVVAVILFLGTHQVLKSAILWFIMAVILKWIFGQDADEANAPETPRPEDVGFKPDPVLSSAEQSLDRRQAMAGRLAWLAWRNAMWSVMMFPPLAFCASAILIRLSKTRLPLRRIDRLRCLVSTVLIFPGILLTLSLLLSVLLTIMFIVHDIYCSLFRDSTNFY